MELEIPKHIMFKLEAWRDFGSTEVTGFFITEKNNATKVIDATIIKSKCTMTTVDISPETMDAFYFNMAEKGIYPDQLQIWWHTHPNSSAQPSNLDQKTFETFGMDRSLNIMYILAKNGNEFAQISVTDIKTGIMLKTDLKISHPFTSWASFPSYSELQLDYNQKIMKPSPVDCYNYFVDTLPHLAQHNRWKKNHKKTSFFRASQRKLFNHKPPSLKLINKTTAKILS